MHIEALIAVAMAAAAPQPPSDAAQQAPGPPLTTPLKRQGDDAPIAAQPRRSVADAAPPTSALAPLAAGSTAPPAEASVTAYPASFFAAMGPNSAADMIGRLPGFSFTSGSSVRGFDGAAGNVLIDGQRPVSKTDDLNSILVRVPASQVERIDLIHGGAAGIDMHGYTVIANVIRKKGAATTGLFGVSNQWVLTDGRQVPAVRLEGSRRANGQVLEGSIVAAGFVDDGGGDGDRVRRDATGRIISVADDKTESDGTQVVATAAHERPLLGGRLRINGSYLGQRYTYDERAAEVGPGAYDLTVQRDHQNRQDGELGLNYNRDLGAAHHVELIVLQQVKTEDYLSLFQDLSELDRFREQHVNGESIGRVVLTWRVSPKLTVEYGGEGAYNILHGHSTYSVDGAAIPLPSGKVDVTELRGEVFAKANWTLTPTLTVEGALRMEASRIESQGTTPLSNSFYFPKPRLSATWSPTKNDQFRFRVERVVGQLNFNDFTASSSLSTGQILSGNPNLSPQQSWVVEGAYERRILGDGAVTLTLRHSELADVIDRAPIFTPTGVFDSPANIGDGVRDDLSFSASLPFDKLGVKGFLLKPYANLVRSEVTDPTTGERRQISGVRPYDYGFTFSHDLPQYKFSYGGELKSGFRERYYRFNQVETDAIQPIGSLYFEYRPGKGLQYRVELRDIGLDFDRGLSVYNGPRTQDQLAFAELRSLKLGPIAYARIRKSW